jgi:hypothetical protein
LESALLAAETAGANGEALANEERLRRFATDLGFELLRIDVTQSLDEPRLEPYLKLSPASRSPAEEEHKALAVQYVTERRLRQQEVLLVQHGTDAIRRVELNGRVPFSTHSSRRGRAAPASGR